MTAPEKKAKEETSERRFLRGPQPRWKELVRAIKIFFELLRGFRVLHFVGPCVTIFGSARFKEGHRYYEMSRLTAKALSEVGFSIITGGGPGLMEAANRGAKEGNGVSIGCNIHLPMEQRKNAFLDIWIEFQHFFVRKLMLAKYSYAFVALPGGFGTLDEVFEVATLVQTGKIQRFPIVLMGLEYWKPMVDFMKKTMVAEGTIEAIDVNRIIVSDSPQEVATLIKENGLREFGLTYGPVYKKRWWFFERKKS